MQPTITGALNDAKLTVYKFGIELEMCHQGGYDDWDEGCPDCGSCGSAYCDDCEHCDRCYDGYTPDRGSDGDVQTAINAMARQGLVPRDAHLHSYHCGCSDCAYSRREPFFATQQDCTVGVEFVSRICRDPEDLGEVDKVVVALGDAYRNGVPQPDGHDTWGNHIHVGCHPYSVAYWASALFASDNWDWDFLASGGCRSGSVRGYNSKPQKHGGWDAYQGNWAAERSHTCEFRLWNTPAKPERLGFHVCASLAIARWATAMNQTYSHPQSLIRTFDERQCPTETLDMLTQVWPNHPDRDDHLSLLARNHAC